MLLFRSEEHVDRWCAQWNQPRGEVITLAQGWGLGAWYKDRLDPTFQRKNADEIEAFFTGIGLTSAFWSVR